MGTYITIYNANAALTDLLMASSTFGREAFRHGLTGPCWTTREAIAMAIWEHLRSVHTAAIMDRYGKNEIEGETFVQTF